MPLFNYPYISNTEDHCPNFWGKTTSNLRYCASASMHSAHTPLDVLLVNCKRVTLKVWHFTRFLLANWEKLTISQAILFSTMQCWNWERFRKQILIKPYIHNTPYGRPKSVKKINHTYLIRSKQWTLFPKINWHYVWSIRERRVTGILSESWVKQP